MNVDITVNAVVDDATMFAAGDIAIVGLNSNGDMDIAFVLLKDIEADTEIYLTDRGWSNTTGFITTESEEGILQWNVTSRLTAERLSVLLLRPRLYLYLMDRSAILQQRILTYLRSETRC